MEIILGPTEDHGASEVDQKSPVATMRVEGAPRGAGGAPCLVASSLLTLHGLQVSRVDFLPKILSVRFIPFGLRLIFLFYEAKKHGKNRNWHWVLG